MLKQWKLNVFQVPEFEPFTDMPEKVIFCPVVVI
jgi:hypothetical protein